MHFVISMSHAIFPSLFFSSRFIRKTRLGYYSLAHTQTHIHFTEPMAQILGGPDLFVDKGSTINLTCTIRFGTEPGGHIFWYHESKVCRHNNLSLSAIT